MVYLDTSVAFPIFVPEDNSERVVAWLDGCDDPLIASAWIVTEFSSALALNQRQGKIHEDQAADIWQEFLVFCQEGLRLVRITPEDFEVAARSIRVYQSGLRAGDALHLAVALMLGVSGLATADAVLGRVAASKGVQVISFQTD